MGFTPSWKHNPMITFKELDILRTPGVVLHSYYFLQKLAEFDDSGKIRLLKTSQNTISEFPDPALALKRAKATNLDHYCVNNLHFAHSASVTPAELNLISTAIITRNLEVAEDAEVDALTHTYRYLDKSPAGAKGWMRVGNYPTLIFSLDENFIQKTIESLK